MCYCWIPDFGSLTSCTIAHPRPKLQLWSIGVRRSDCMCDAVIDDRSATREAKEAEGPVDLSDCLTFLGQWTVGTRIVAVFTQGARKPRGLPTTLWDLRSKLWM